MSAPPEIMRWQQVLHSGFFDSNVEMARDLLENTSLDAAGIIAKLAALLPDAVAATPAATSTPPPAAASSASEPVPMSVESRRVLFRQMAGPRLTAFADALAESPAGFDEAKGLIAVARADLPPESRLPPGYVTIEARAKGAVEMGASFDFAPSKAEVAKAGWDKAFAKVAGRT